MRKRQNERRKFANGLWRKQVIINTCTVLSDSYHSRMLDSGVVENYNGAPSSLLDEDALYATAEIMIADVPFLVEFERENWIERIARLLAARIPVHRIQRQIDDINVYRDRGIDNY